MLIKGVATEGDMTYFTRDPRDTTYHGVFKEDTIYASDWIAAFKVRQDAIDWLTAQEIDKNV